jgi:hypothetical protein
MKTNNPLNIKPISEAERIKGKRILAYVDAAESPNGWMEMYWTGLHWRSWIDHPFTNACLDPMYFMEVPEVPKETA